MKAQNFISTKSSVFILIAPVIFILLSFVVFRLLQEPAVYHATINKVGFTYERINNADGSRKEILQLKNTPFQKITNEKLTHWDAIIYQDLAKNFYRKDRKDLYAFFPAFPLLLKITQAPNDLIIYINLLLFLIGYIIFYFVLQNHLQLSKRNTDFIYLLLLALPTLTIFSIPYAEACAFISFSLGLYFMLKRKMLPACICFFLLAWCRPNTLMLLLAACAALVLFMFKTKNKDEIKIPLITTVGGLFIGIISLFTFYGISSGDFFVFFEAQKNWGTQFQLPKLPFTDYAEEVYRVNLIILFVLTPLSLIKLYHVYFVEKTSYNAWFYVRLFSNLYFIFTSLTVVFFQGGSLHSLHRYILATPIGLIFIADLCKTVLNKKLSARLIIFICFLLGCLFAVYFTKPDFPGNFMKNSHGTMFANMGFVIFMMILSLLFWLPKDSRLWKGIYLGLVALTLVLAICWDTVLYNIFLSRGWLWA